MQKFTKSLKDNFWPVSAIFFCPCHLPLTMNFVAMLTAGTAVGSYFAAHFSAIETVLAVTFSFYFVVAFLIWMVRGPKQRKGAACVVDPEGNKRLSGLSTKQIIIWGVIAMLITPMLTSVSLFTNQDMMHQTALRQAIATIEYNSGLIWLTSLALVVMIPVMIVWLAWLWLAWAHMDLSRYDLGEWTYEFD